MPLGGGHDAVALIARACRSRLFGYFFAIPSGHVPAHDELRALTADGAIAALLFGGAAIEQARWPLIATSLAFDPRCWPFPQFASRGAFGESWTRVRYDPDTMQIVERTTVDADAVAELADARFSDAREIEAHLRKRLAGKCAPLAQRICEVRSPLDRERLHEMKSGGRIQFSTTLQPADMQRLAEFFGEHPHVELRVHGLRHGLDARSLAEFTSLRKLTLDVRALQHPQSLRALTQLRVLRIGGVQIDLGFLDALLELEAIELRGTRASLQPVLDLPSLRTLVLENTRTLDLRALASAATLEDLVLAHGAYDARGVSALKRLRSLELRSLEIASLPDLGALPDLHRLRLDALASVTELGPLVRAQALRELRIAGMPQLNVADFRPLLACAALQDLDLEIGSRRKEREIYRLLGRARCRSAGPAPGGREPEP